MRRIAALGFALIGATVLIAMSAVGASAAEPAFYECKKLTKNAEGKYEGGFTNKACSETSVAHEGKYELKEGIGTKPTIKGKSGKAELESSLGSVSCTSSKSIGQLETPTHIGQIHVAYKGCTSGGKKCNSTGAKAGTIETKELQGDLGYLNKGAHEAGVLITPVSTVNLAEFNCEGLEIATKGGVIGQATPVNTFTKLGELTFEKSGAATQKFRKFEGETATHELETTFVGIGGPVPSSQEQTNVQKGGFLEIKA
jgi:hypothetical protein